MNLPVQVAYFFPAYSQVLRVEGRDRGQQGGASGMRRGVPWRDVKQEAQPHESRPSAAHGAHTVAGGLEGENLEPSNSWGKWASPRQSAQRLYLEKPGSTASIHQLA